MESMGTEGDRLCGCGGTQSTRASGMGRPRWAGEVSVDAAEPQRFSSRRRIHRRFDASTSGRKRTLLKNVLHPGSFNNQQLRQATEQHERLVRDLI
eukprot:2673484-Amphidinium_carterae.1